jgi:hypothetical protein
VRRTLYIEFLIPPRPPRQGSIREKRDGPRAILISSVSGLHEKATFRPARSIPRGPVAQRRLSRIAQTRAMHLSRPAA